MQPATTHTHPQGAAITGSQTTVRESLAAMTTQSAPQQQRVPAHPVGTGTKSKWMLPSDLGSDDKAVLATVQQLLQARSMAEHHKVFANMAQDILWDAPPVLLKGRDSMRVMVYTAKRIATLDYEPLLVQREVMSANHHNLVIEAMVHVRPLRPFWPLTWALPEDIPIRATVKVGVYKSPSEPAGSWGVITSLWGWWHNYPFLPYPFRVLSALSMGYALKWTEGLWTPGLPLIGDTSVMDRETTGPAAQSRY